MSVLFTSPKIPKITSAPPPTPVRNPQAEAEQAQAGRQLGLLATLFGFRSSAAGGGKSGKTGQSGGAGGHPLTGR